MDAPDKNLAAALGRIPSGLYILTLKRGDISTGMLASWVQQCSFQPPRITVGVKQGREVLGQLEPGSLFTLNQLEEGQTDLVAHFGRGFSWGAESFEGLPVDRDAPSGPVLQEALAVLECQASAHWVAGDHVLVLADVKAGRMLDEGHPMVHIRKNGFHY